MYDELLKRLRNCTAEQNGEKTLWCQAADAIEELQDTVQAQDRALRWCADQLARRWIPVTERLTHSGWCLVACNEWGGSVIRKAVYDEATGKWFEFPCGGAKDITEYVTHWMPLPEPPREG